MSVATEHDRIWWTPVGFPEQNLPPGDSRHECTMAVVMVPTFRIALDPMALGTCRYCKQPLP